MFLFYLALKNERGNEQENNERDFKHGINEQDFILTLFLPSLLVCGIGRV